jgi:transcriptional regulator with XRE-family HTH domain
MLWENVGKRIKKLREERNLSKSQFGKMVGVTGQYIGMIEKGTHSISVKLIVKICDATGVSADYILFGVTDSEQEVTTAASLYGLSNEQIQIALDIIKRVAQFINTENGNEALIREVAAQQHIFTNNNGNN